jgi:membrane fusion protein (multidrug efflux system)
LVKRNVLSGLFLLFAIFVVAGVLGYWKYNQIKAASGQPQMEPPQFVEVLTADSSPWQPTARLVGTVVAKRAVMLANEILGVITEVGFDSGQVVQKGQVLLKLDDSTEQADLTAALAAERLANASHEAALANIRAAEANLNLARSNLRRSESAALGNAISPQELDRDKAELEKATADLDKEKSAKTKALAELDQAKARTLQIRTIIAKKTLIAPFRARTGMRTVHPGQYLASGTSIVDLTELTDEIYLDFAVPQKYVPQVKPGAVVMAKSSILGSQSVPVKIVSVDATVNNVTRNVRVRTTVPDPTQALKPGMFIDVEIPIEESKDFVMVPTTAVRRSAAGEHVFVLQPGDTTKGDPPDAMRAQQRPVMLGSDIGGRVIVLNGLKPGEMLAAAGSFKLRDGALVMASPLSTKRQPAAPNKSSH